MSSSWSRERERIKEGYETRKGQRTLSSNGADLLPQVLSGVLERARSGLVGDFGRSVSHLEMGRGLGGRSSRWEARDGESSDRSELMARER
jgi:hypothetical protein